MANALLYAEDTVLYFARKDVGIIERTLTRKLEEVVRYLDENELVIKLKEGKAEVMLFGTAKRLSLKNRELSIKYRGREINVTKEYTHLGYTLDNTLKLNGCFNTAIQKVLQLFAASVKLSCGIMLPRTLQQRYFSR